MALENNRKIKIAVNRVEMADNQATIGQAGLLPNLSANGSYSTGESDTKIEVANQAEDIETNNAKSTNLQAGVNLDYTVFSGFANQRTYQKLKINTDLTDANSRLEIEGIVLQVAAAYYNVDRTASNLDALKQAATASEDRLNRAKARRELSGGTKLNELNAQVDFNKDRVALLDAEKAYQDALDNLYLLINSGEPTTGTPGSETFNTFGNLKAFSLADLKADMLEQNAQLLSARFTEQASLLDYKIAKSAYFPQLKLNGSYAFSRNEAEGSFLRSNESLGYTAGLTLSIPLYQGGKRNINTQNKRIQYTSSTLQAEETELTLIRDLKAAHRDYLNSLAVLDLEEENQATAQLNFDYSKDKYQQGLLTGLQFREAQINLLLANNNLSNVRYNAQLAELELLRLTGALLQE